MMCKELNDLSDVESLASRAGNWYLEQGKNHQTQVGIVSFFSNRNEGKKLKTLWL